ncbi:hypothetical protein [Leptolyngbya iicbica]|uniref:Uncharacterized protein n=2 Tax=Cyanophyceae TaxID=3028117 RepID=A0A4Q7E379_9CYAN|nr:hypothetical protein [Leptolyngbya sp. LK]RZM75692.1 hypothetical protein DYY88_20550 [Leptolyngbya sp. LK]
MTIQEIYSQVTRILSPTDRLRLATLILNDLVQDSRNIVDDNDAWTEQDQLDLSAYALQHAVAVFPDEEMTE